MGIRIIAPEENCPLVTEADLEGARGERALPVFCNHLFLCNHIGELQTLLFEVVLIIINAPLIFVYPDPIQTCLTPNHCLFGSQLLYSCNGTSTVVTNLTVFSSVIGKINVISNHSWDRWRN